MAIAASVVTVAGFAVDRYILPSPPHPAEVAPPVRVVAKPVMQEDVPIVLSGLGTVQALNTAVVRSQVTGLVQTVNFKEGQKVKRGDLLAQIDARPEQAALDQAQATASRDAAHLANAQTNLGRDLPLLSHGYATEQVVAGEKSQVVQLQNDVKSDQAAVENAQTQLSYTSLVAPFDGVTGIRMLDVGNIVHPTDANGLVAVTQVQPIAVVFTLPAAAIASVQQAVSTGAVSATAFDQAGKQQLDVGQLLTVNNQADPNSGTVQLKALFPNPKLLLWPGTFVNVELTLRVVHDGLTIPTDAVQLGSSGSFVFVIGLDNKVAVTQVEVAQRERGKAYVTKGLQVGQTVVEQGQYSLVGGTSVIASEPQQVANTSPATAGLLP